MRMVRALLAALGLAGLLTACQIGVERSPDGSLRVEATMSEEQLETELRAALGDPGIEEVQVETQAGYLMVMAERSRTGEDVVDTLTFRLELAAVGGHLDAQVSDVVVDGFSISEARVQRWNERIAANLERAGARRPNSRLERVVVSEGGVTMVWRVETARSRGR